MYPENTGCVVVVDTNLDQANERHVGFWDAVGVKDWHQLRLDPGARGADKQCHGHKTRGGNSRD